MEWLAYGSDCFGKGKSKEPSNVFPISPFWETWWWKGSPPDIPSQTRVASSSVSGTNETSRRVLSVWTKGESKLYRTWVRSPSGPPFQNWLCQWILRKTHASSSLTNCWPIFFLSLTKLETAETPKRSQSQETLAIVVQVVGFLTALIRRYRSVPSSQKGFLTASLRNWEVDLPSSMDFFKIVAVDVSGKSPFLSGAGFFVSTSYSIWEY